MKKIILLTIFILCSMASIQAQRSRAVKLELKWATDTLFKVPESVLLDEANDILYVSNIVGNSKEKDGQGFISKLKPDGTIVTLEWVSGLHAPKGMALHNGMLYVADISRVVMIDTHIAQIANIFEVNGATFLNDVTVDQDGRVFISDSDKGRIHKLENNTVSVFFESADLKRVNGLLAIDDHELYVVDAGTGIHYTLKAGKRLEKYSETSAGADGIIRYGKNEYIVSSWGGEIFHVDKKGQSTKILDTRDQKINAADIAYHPKLKLLYVPTFFDNRIMAYEVKR